MANYNPDYDDYNPLDPWTDPGGGSDSGGSGPAPDPPGDATTLQEMQVDEGATLALAYGQHVVAGNLVEYDYSSGPPPVLKFITALGEGPWNGVVDGLRQPKAQQSKRRNGECRGLNLIT